MDWVSLVAAALGGGLIGQLLTLTIGKRISARQTFEHWLREKKFRVYTDLVELTSSTKPDCKYEEWPGRVRALCQRIYLLHDNGHVPDDIYYAMEKVFQIVDAKRSRKIEDEKSWKKKLRKASNKLREELAKSLHRHRKKTILERLKSLSKTHSDEYPPASSEIKRNEEDSFF